MGRKFGQLLLAHLRGMPFIVKENEAFNPVDVSLLGANTVMFAADNVPHLIKQFRLARVGRSQYSLCHDSDSVPPTRKLKQD